MTCLFQTIFATMDYRVIGRIIANATLKPDLLLIECFAVGSHGIAQ